MVIKRIKRLKLFMKGLSPVIGVVLLIAISVIAAVGVWYWVGSYTQVSSYVGVDYSNPYVVVSNFNGTAAFLRNLGRASANEAVMVYNSSGVLVGWFGLNESSLEPNAGGVYDLHLLVNDLYAGTYIVLGNGYPKTTFRLSEDYLKPIYVVFFAENDYGVHAYYENGTRYWDSPISHGGYCTMTSTPAIDNGLLFIGDDGGYLSCLDASNGTILWNFTYARDSHSYYLQASPFVKNDVVYFPLAGYVFALNEINGSQLWNRSIYQAWLSDADNYRSSPVILGDYLYVGEGQVDQDKNGSFYKLDINNNGSEVCHYAQEEGNDLSSALIDGGVAYIGGGKPYNYTYAFYTDNCTVKWNKSLSSQIYASPLLVGDYLIISTSANDSDNRTYALNVSADDSNRVIWNTSFRGRIASSAFYHDGLLYLGGGEDGYLHVLNLTTGSEAWNYSTGADFYDSPVVANGLVYFGDYNNVFTALNVSNHTPAWTATFSHDFIASPVVCNIRNWDCTYPTISGMAN